MVTRTQNVLPIDGVVGRYQLLLPRTVVLPVNEKVPSDKTEKLAERGEIPSSPRLQGNMSLFTLGPLELMSIC
jgi:hypothetical protein